MKRNQKILITGFEAFASHAHNPTQKLLADLNALNMSQVETLLLPVSYKNAYLKAKLAIESLQPDVVIATGLAGDRDCITVERVAINCESASIPDNDDDHAVERLADKDGPNAYFASLPVIKIVNELSSLGIETKISNSAGTYVCNSLMYKLLHQAKGDQFVTGFIHFPPTKTNDVNSKWESSDYLKAMIKVIEMLCEQ